MSGSWVISRFPAADLHDQTVEFRLPGQHHAVHGIGTFKAQALSGRRVSIWIRLQLSSGWERREDILFRVPQDGCGRIEIHPDQSVARYRLFAL